MPQQLGMPKYFFLKSCRENFKLQIWVADPVCEQKQDFLFKGIYKVNKF